MLIESAPESIQTTDMFATLPYSICLNPLERTRQIIERELSAHKFHKSAPTSAVGKLLIRSVVADCLHHVSAVPSLPTTSEDSRDFKLLDGKRQNAIRFEDVSDQNQT